MFLDDFTREQVSTMAKPIFLKFDASLFENLAIRLIYRHDEAYFDGRL